MPLPNPNEIMRTLNLGKNPIRHVTPQKMAEVLSRGDPALRAHLQRLPIGMQIQWARQQGITDEMLNQALGSAQKISRPGGSGFMAEDY